MSSVILWDWSGWSCRCCDQERIHIEHIDAGPAFVLSLPPCEEDSCVEVQPVVEFTFALPDGGSTSVSFTERPLGLKFSETASGSVKVVNSRRLSDDVIVKSGWRLTQIDGDNIEHLSPNELRLLIARRVRLLKMV
uniref:Uncharacterized protein n=1 Tax=Noctiluca scintillans TaxID=2966 RepID=A0A7S1AS44_NOCSC|mmetsp:Transcript_57682/g.153716  ORF Transcript_57682/g.153716 Transcript_57682/m.153716 type:complete len:136 (+) Transcript_57682:52-459(+)